MNNLIDTIEYKGYKIKVYPSEDTDSPNDWGDTDVFLVYDHRQFNIKRKGFDPEDIFQHWTKGKKTYEGYWIFPVLAHIHGGVNLSLGYTSNDRWDTSFRGFALVQRQKGWTYTEEKARAVAKLLLVEWNQYLSGEVYGYVIEDEDGNDKDSCWGFYGDYEDYMLTECKSIIDHLVVKEENTKLVNSCVI